MILVQNQQQIRTGIVKYKYIPCFHDWITVNIVSVSSQTIDSTKFIFHKVVKNETSYGIAKNMKLVWMIFFSQPNASAV